MADNEDVILSTSVENTEPVAMATNDDESASVPVKGVESLRIQITNLPKFANFPQVKQYIPKVCPDMKFSKLKVFGQTAYLSFDSVENVEKAIKVFEGHTYKQNVLSAKRVEGVPERKITAPSAHMIKTAREINTPLADMPYDEQLEFKQLESIKIFNNLKTLSKREGINVKRWSPEMVKDIVRSEKIEKYRNKIELTVGRGENGEVCVGAVPTKLASHGLLVVPLENVTHAKDNTIGIYKAFDELVKKSVDKFDLVKTGKCDDQPGPYKTILIRDFTDDCLAVVTIDSGCGENVVEEIKKDLKDALLTENDNFKVDSLYLVIQKNASDRCDYIPIGDTKFVYEYLFGIKFKISPDTFFQTNTYCTERLYTVIGDALGLPVADQDVRMPFVNGENQDGSILLEKCTGKALKRKTAAESGSKKPNADVVAANVDDKSTTADGESASKKIKVDIENGADAGGLCGNVVAEGVSRRILLLDICCGVGTIGLSMAKRIAKAQEQGKFDGLFGLVGVEIVKKAIEGAQETIKANFMENPDNYKFFAASAESIFNQLNLMAPKCFKDSEGKLNLKKGEVVGVLDPPRAGVHNKVIMGCRKMEELTRLVFVSCDPTAALKNLVDLCRPVSRRYEGGPFRLVSIQPVDMFPMTKHFEWVIQLER